MITILLAVRDQKANCFTQPFTAPSRAIALRSWTDQLNDPDNRKHDQVRHPEDFSLWILGEYDDNHGLISPKTPEQLAIASDLITGA